MLDCSPGCHPNLSVIRPRHIINCFCCRGHLVWAQLATTNNKTFSANIVTAVEDVTDIQVCCQEWAVSAEGTRTQIWVNLQEVMSYMVNSCGTLFTAKGKDSQTFDVQLANNAEAIVLSISLNDTSIPHWRAEQTSFFLMQVIELTIAQINWAIANSQIVKTNKYKTRSKHYTFYPL